MVYRMTNANRISSESGVLTATIPISTKPTGAEEIPTGGATKGSYSLPDAFTGATVTIGYSNDGSNFTTVPALTDENNPETVAADGTYPLPSRGFSAKYLQISSASNEAAARTITVYLKG